MSGLVEAPHPAATIAHDEEGRAVHLYPSERHVRLECLRLVADAAKAAETAPLNSIAWAFQPTATGVVAVAKLYADFVLGITPAPETVNQAAPVDVKAEEPPRAPLSEATRLVLALERIKIDDVRRMNLVDALEAESKAEMHHREAARLKVKLDGIARDLGEPPAP